MESYARPSYDLSTPQPGAAGPDCLVDDVAFAEAQLRRRQEDGHTSVLDASSAATSWLLDRAN